MAHGFLIGLLLAVTTAAAAAPADDPALPWSTVGDQERRLVEGLLESRHWPDRVFGMLRLERYRGAAVESLVTARLADESWLVRCFAVHQAVRMEADFSPRDLQAERDGRVLREALRCGIALDADRVEAAARTMMRQRSLDELMLGMEIAAASDIASLRVEATQRIERLLRNLDEATLIRISRRLARLLYVVPEPIGLEAWAAWWQGRGATVELPPSSAWNELTTRPVVADMDAETFFRLMDYLDGLRQQDLDLVIVMDATASMRPMIDEARAGVESLVLFLNDLARNGRLAFVAYRDHDNEPVWEGHPFTREAASIRRFLYGVKITGGADYPEAVLDGVAACGELDWNARARRLIVVVGDAEPHRRDQDDLAALLGRISAEGVLVHAAHVPMRPLAATLNRMPPEHRVAYQRQIDAHNVRTEEAFEAIARLGGGSKVTLDRADELVPAIMHLTLDQGWWPAFDEFYTLYLRRCR